MHFQEKRHRRKKSCNQKIHQKNIFPIKKERGDKTNLYCIKLYICLFVCATTRAVHLEVVDNLSATSFILCLRRLAAAKGIPSTIISDNHKTFISGEKFLLDLQEDDNVRKFLQDHRIQWRHQTPRSPWMGRHFERLVRTIKTSLSSAIARKLYNQEEFATIVKEVDYR